jgi:hypothetical protein
LHFASFKNPTVFINREHDNRTGFDSSGLPANRYAPQSSEHRIGLIEVFELLPAEEHLKYISCHDKYSENY